MLDYHDWSQVTTHEQSKHLLVLDNDIASVEITLVEFEALVANPHSVVGHDALTVAQDCGKRFASGTNVILLAPDVAEVFRDSEAVNDALRQYLAEHGSPPSK